MSDKTRLINIRTHKGNDYIRIDRRSIFGNPFIIGKDGTREAVIELYRTYSHVRLKEDPKFRNAVEALRGKILGCWCAPKACHGDVIIEYLDNMEDDHEQERQRQA